MAKKNVLTKDSFDVLLRWLDLDREMAGHKYEKIRQRLIRFFIGRGCFEAEELADETINRVIHKLPQLIDDYTGEPALYFYGVAQKIHLEWLREEKKKRDLHLPPPSHSDDEDDEMDYLCLENCIETLVQDHRRLVVEYYREDGRAKIEYRKDLSVKLGISINALHIKVCRIRAVLEKCVLNCIAARSN